MIINWPHTRPRATPPARPARSFNDSSKNSDSNNQTYDNNDNNNIIVISIIGKVN